MKWLAIILALAACSKGPPTIDPSPKQVESPDQNPPVPPKPDAAPPDGPPAPDLSENPQFFTPRDIKPPPARNVVPVKTQAAIADTKLRALSAIDVPDWKHDPAGIIDHVAILHYRTVTRPTVSVDVVIQPCMIEGKQRCFGMDLVKWQAPENLETLDEAFPTAARAKPAKAETGAVAIAPDGTVAIFEYHLATIPSTDIRGHARLQPAHAYTLHYTDGTNRIRVTAYYDDAAPKDPPPKDLETLAQAVTKDQLLATARGFFDLFTSQWQ